MRGYLPMVICILVVGWPGISEVSQADPPWAQAEQAGFRTQRAIQFCLNLMNAWLAHADPSSGLLPRRLNNDRYWNARDCAADNFPFLTILARTTGLPHAIMAMDTIFQRERELTPRGEFLGLPDSWDFARASFLKDQPDFNEAIFGASEYAKDGLMPMTEWLGRGPWFDRMIELTDTLYGLGEKLGRQPTPTDNLEVLGNLLQVNSRLYWMTGDRRFADRAFAIADELLIHRPMIRLDRIILDDHGCEAIGGLAEAYVLAGKLEPARRDTYRAPILELYRLILNKGANEDGLLYNWFEPATDAHAQDLTDSWGYNYNAFLALAIEENDPELLDACRRVLNSIHRYLGYPWDHASADGYADSIESAINLINRLGPVPSTLQWIEQSLEHIYAGQRPDGMLEAWYGDGNSIRTVLMYVLMCTRGCTVRPWRPDIRLGVIETDGALYLTIQADYDWQGELRADRPRHRYWHHLPWDYPRINQFQEWFTLDDGDTCLLELEDQPPETVIGAKLRHYPLSVPAGRTLRLKISVKSRAERTQGGYPDSSGVYQTAFEPWREMALSEVSSAEELVAWQHRLRNRLRTLLRVPERLPDVPLDPRVESERRQQDGTIDQLLTVAGYTGRPISLRVRMPAEALPGSLPGVVALGGHGSHLNTVFEDPQYKQFATLLAARGTVVVAVDLARHETLDPDTTLMGERLLDACRAVDYLYSLPEVDPGRIGCAGLSLGGEMAMWLGAMDDRIRFVCAMGFLTWMNQMERNHCMCWKVEGIREVCDFPDLYALIAPRPLQLQLGRQEPLEQFNVIQGESAFRQLRRAWQAAGLPQNVQLLIHPGGHEVDLPGLLAFFTGNW